MPTLNAGREVKFHVVAQVVKAEFIIRSVSNVRRIRRLAFKIVHVVLNAADFQTEKAMYLAHPLRIARGEVIIDGYDMHTPAPGQGVQISRQCSDQRFAFAGSHLSNFALVQNDAPDQLHIEMAHAGGANACFSYNGKGFGQDLVEGLALETLAVLFIPRPGDGSLKLLFEFRGAIAELFV